MKILDKIALEVEVLNTPEAMAEGLQFKPPLPEGKGMLFDFGETRNTSFHTHNCLFDMDIIFLNEDYSVIKAYHSVPPESDNITCQNARYALETNGGWAKENGISNGSIIKSASFDINNLWSKREELMQKIFTDYKRGLKQERWDVIPAARLIKVWNDYSRTGIVRDERAIEDFEEIMVENVLKIDANNELAGHSSVNPDEIFEEYGVKPDDSKFFDYIGDKISDYGIDKLWKLLEKLKNDKTPEDKLLTMDMMLNVVHQRSDMAANFVQGGSSTLSQLKGDIAVKANIINAVLKEAYQVDIPWNPTNKIVPWDNKFLTPEIAKQIGDRRYTYIKLSEFDPDERSHAIRAYVHKAYADEHYYYPAVKRDGKWVLGKGRRTLAIPHKMLLDSKAMEKLGYEKVEGK